MQPSFVNRCSVLGAAAAGLCSADEMVQVAVGPDVAAPPTESVQPERSQCCDVIVIGGGISGLAAAHRLKQKGLSIVLLEARDRLGGRIYTQRIEPGVVIDLGAQFLGDAQRRISALVDEAKLTRVAPHQKGDSLYSATTGDIPPLRLGGDDLPLSVIGQLDAYQATCRLSRSTSMDSADAARRDALAVAAHLGDITFTRQTQAYLLNSVESEFCMPGDEISALELWKQIQSIGGLKGQHSSEQWFLAEGTGSLIQHLANALGSSCVLNAAAFGVEQQPDSVTVRTRQGTFTAKQLIVAVPPQLYGRMGLLPALSYAQQKVIAEFKLGSAVKNIFVFPTPWWRERGLSGGGSRTGGLFNSMADASPASGKVGILVLFSTGTSGRRLAAARSEDLRINLLMKELSSWVGGPVPAPTFARSVNWNEDPWSLGGYASRRGLHGWVQAPDLFKSRGRIHFAGTETADEWRSFMEGALQSAERAASEVLRHFEAGVPWPSARR